MKIETERERESEMKKKYGKLDIRTWKLRDCHMFDKHTTIIFTNLPLCNTQITTTLSIIQVDTKTNQLNRNKNKIK